MLLVNILGAPGCGKSTVAAGVFHDLKIAGYNVELITEYTKELIIKGDIDTLSDELLVFSEKYRRIAQMTNVDIVITDSPLLNSVVYGAGQFPQTAVPFYKEVAATFDNLYFYLGPRDEYVPFGRMPNKEDAEKCGEDIKAVLDAERITYYGVHKSDVPVGFVGTCVKNEAAIRDIKTF